MARLHIEGGHRLRGEVTVHGAKNSALPLLAATLLIDGTCELQRCPPLSDVAVAVTILQELGCTVERDGETVRVDASGVNDNRISEALMRQMRSSIVFLGAIAARTGEAYVSLPGGCELGARPVDWHVAALRQMGLQVEEAGGRLNCRAEEGRLHGASIALTFPSVGATENILLAAVTARGRTELFNAAREPEIVDLCAFLTACGAHITGAGDSVITVEGVERLHGCVHRIIPDRIEAVTYLAAAAITGGTVTLRQVCPSHLVTVLPVLEEMGCTLCSGEAWLRLYAPSRLARVNSIRTMPYPGFPTDAQALLMAMACAAEGTSVFVETMFESRYKHVGELRRLGADIQTEGRVAVVQGVPSLSGAPVQCTDLRGGAALVLAGLAARGETVLSEICHLDRGYAALESGLSGLGATVRRTET